MATEQRYFDLVEPGDEIGPEEQHPTHEKVKTYLTAAGGTLQGQVRFYDDEAARAQGLRSAILPGAMGLAMLSKLLTDWAGTQGRLRSIDVAFRRMIDVGDPIACQGVIIDKEIVDGQGQVRIDVEIKNLRTNESPTVGTAVMILPQQP